MSQKLPLLRAGSNLQLGETYPGDPTAGQYENVLDPSFAFSFFSAGYNFEGSNFTRTDTLTFDDYFGTEDFFQISGSMPAVVAGRKRHTTSVQR